MRPCPSVGVPLQILQKNVKGEQKSRSPVFGTRRRIPRKWKLWSLLFLMPTSIIGSIFVVHTAKPGHISQQVIEETFSFYKNKK